MLGAVYNNKRVFLNDFNVKNSGELYRYYKSRHTLILTSKVPFSGACNPFLLIYIIDLDLVRIQILNKPLSLTSPLRSFKRLKTKYAPPPGVL